MLGIASAIYRQPEIVKDLIAPRIAHGASNCLVDRAIVKGFALRID